MSNVVFIINVIENKNSGMSDVFVFDDVDDVNLKLEEITYGHTNYENIEVFSGIIIPSEHIPASFDGTIPHILIQNPDRVFDETVSDEAYFFKSSSDPKVVTEKIEELMAVDDLFFSSYAVESPVIGIEDVKLFFGYAMLPVLQIIEESVDEEVFERLEKIKDAATNIKNKIEK